MNDLIPNTFPALALAHLLALLSPGPDFFLIAGHAIRHRLAGCGYLCLGVALGNGVYIASAILGWSALRQQPLLFSTMAGLGGSYLLWLGGRLLTSPARALALDGIAEQRLGAASQCLMGLLSALLNPKNGLFYLSLMTVILGQRVTLGQQLVCGAWMVAVVLGWDLLLAALIGHRRIRSLLARRLYLVERAAGTVLLLFGFGLLGQLFIPAG